MLWLWVLTMAGIRDLWVQETALVTTVPPLPVEALPGTLSPSEGYPHKVKQVVLDLLACFEWSAISALVGQLGASWCIVV